MLRVAKVSETKVSKDNRNYKTVYFEPYDEDVLSNRKPVGRNLWETDPSGNFGDPLYYKVKEGSVVRGEIATLDTEDYKIYSENGKEQDDHGSYNTVNQVSLVVFDNENSHQRAISQGYTPVDTETGEVLDRKGEKAGESLLKSEAQRTIKSEQNDQPF